MTFYTSRFGEIEIPEDKVIAFPEGMVGFTEHTQFILIAHDSQSPFLWMQSLISEEIAFLTINPMLVRPDYAPSVEAKDLELLELEDLAQGVLHSIVIIPEDIQGMTTNLAAPVLINHKLQRGKQVILCDDQYSCQHRIIKETQRIIEQMSSSNS